MAAVDDYESPRAGGRREPAPSAKPAPVYEDRLKNDHGVTNTAEEERRVKRVAKMAKVAAAAGRPASSLLLIARRATQRSVKFVRWLRHAIREDLAEAVAAPRLASLYATL